MALTVTTLRPNSTSQIGSGTVVGAASASAALSDSSDSTYVQIGSRCRLDSQVIRVGFPTPTIPAGAKVYSVGLRRRIQTVATGSSQPVCHHWFRSSTGSIQVAGQAQNIQKLFFNSVCPASATATWVDESLGTFTTAPGGQAWDPATNLSGFSYDIGRGDDFAPALRVSAVYLDITYQQAAGVTVTGPTGTSQATRPTVTWTYSSADSQPQQAYRVSVYTAAQVAAPGFTAFTTTPIQSSGTTSGSTAANYWVLGEDLQWTLPADITDGNYKVFVQATSRWAGSGDFPTSIASSTWVRAATPSNPPPAAVLSSATFDAANNRVALTFAPGGSSPATTAFTVQSSSDGGQFWQAIPRLTYLPANGMTPIIDYDYVAPLNVQTQYRVIAYSGSVLVAATSPSNVLSVTPSDDRHWLKHPSNPLLNTVLPVAAPKTSDTGIKVTKRRMMGTFQLLGGPGSQVLPIVVNGPTYGDEHEIECFFSLDQLTTLWPAVDQLDRAGGTLLFQKPNGDQLWVALGPGVSGQETEETYNTRNPKRIQWRRRKLILTETVTPDFY